MYLSLSHITAYDELYQSFPLCFAYCKWSKTGPSVFSKPERSLESWVCKLRALTEKVPGYQLALTLAILISRAQPCPTSSAISQQKLDRGEGLGTRLTCIFVLSASSLVPRPPTSVWPGCKANQACGKQVAPCN